MERIGEKLVIDDLDGVEVEDEDEEEDEEEAGSEVSEMRKGCMIGM